MVDCILCGSELTVEPLPVAGYVDLFGSECPTCGDYLISGSVATTLPHREQRDRRLLAGVVRAASDRGSQLTITHDSIDGLLESSRPPKDPFEAADRLLLHVRHQMGRLDSAVPLSGDSDFTVLYADGPGEFVHHLGNLIKLGFLEEDEEGNLHDSYRITLDGWRRLQELGQSPVDSSQAFVAMWFDESLTPVWEEGFHPALEEAGYNPFRIDLHEHNDRIDERIVAEIRRSGLLVADFTGHRGGVYFEAGLALGLGIPVIWTCRADELEDSHFDTRQYNHIAWDDPAGLKDRLLDRIRATVAPHSQ